MKVKYTNEDMAKMYCLGLLNQKNPTITMDSLHTQLQTAQQKIDKVLAQIDEQELFGKREGAYTETEVRELLYSLAHTIPGTMLNVGETNNFFHMFCEEKLLKS